MMAKRILSLTLWSSVAGYGRCVLRYSVYRSDSTLDIGTLAAVAVGFAAAAVGDRDGGMLEADAGVLATVDGGDSGVAAGGSAGTRGVAAGGSRPSSEQPSTSMSMRSSTGTWATTFAAAG